MKKEMKTFTTSKEVWIAKDGTEFNEEQKCKDYEQSLECTINAAWNKIPKTEIYYDELFWSGCDEDCLMIIKPRNMEDVKIVNMKCNLKEADCLTQDDIGKEITFQTYYDGEYYKLKTTTPFKDIIATIDEQKKRAADDIKNYGYYEIKYTVNGNTTLTKSYSMYAAMKTVKNTIRNELYKIAADELYKTNVTLHIFKDGNPYKDEEYAVEYDKHNYSAFKFDLVEI